MRIATPEIVWHGGEKGQNDPLLSCDIHPSGVLATGGADSDVRMWKLNLSSSPHTNNMEEKTCNEENKKLYGKDNDSENANNTAAALNKLQEFLYSLEGHERSVNCVRFSPDGQHLGTASDGGRVVLFSLPPNKSLRLWLKSKTCPKQLQKSQLRSTQEDIYDLCWSPNSEYFMTGSVDNQVCIWDMETKKVLYSLSQHANYVQGVSWDPLNKYIASQSNDRTCRLYNVKQRIIVEKKKKKNKKSKKNSKEQTTNNGDTQPMAKMVLQKKMNETLQENESMDIVELSNKNNGHTTTTAGDLKEKERKEKTEDNDEASTGGSSFSDNNGVKNSHGKQEKEKDETSVKTVRGKPEVSEYVTLKYRQIRNPNYKKTENTTPSLGKDSGIVLLADTDTLGIEKNSMILEEGIYEKKQNTINEDESTTENKNNNTTHNNGEEQIKDDLLADFGGNEKGTTTTTSNSSNQFWNHLLFADETVPSFFRRLAWSPDGLLLITPSGIFRETNSGGTGSSSSSSSTTMETGTDLEIVVNKPVYRRSQFVSYVFTRHDLTKPALVLPHGTHASVAVRFCPQLYALWEEEESNSSSTENNPSTTNLFSSNVLPYRMLWAILTINAVYVYDSQHHTPIVVIRNNHYATLSDVTWTNDGSGLLVTSMDGYVTIITFDNNELGNKLNLEDVPQSVQQCFEGYYKVWTKINAFHEEEKEIEEERLRATMNRKEVLGVDNELSKNGDLNIISVASDKTSSTSLAKASSASAQTINTLTARSKRKVSDQGLSNSNVVSSSLKISAKEELKIRSKKEIVVQKENENVNDDDDEEDIEMSLTMEEARDSDQIESDEDSEAPLDETALNDLKDDLDFLDQGLILESRTRGGRRGGTSRTKCNTNTYLNEKIEKENSLLSMEDEDLCEKEENDIKMAVNELAPEMILQKKNVPYTSSGKMEMEKEQPSHRGKKRHNEDEESIELNSEGDEDEDDDDDCGDFIDDDMDEFYEDDDLEEEEEEDVASFDDDNDDGDHYDLDDNSMKIDTSKSAVKKQDKKLWKEPSSSSSNHVNENNDFSTTRKEGGKQEKCDDTNNFARMNATTTTQASTNTTSTIPKKPKKRICPKLIQ